MAHARGFPRRKSCHRTPKRRTLVVCDGDETEPNYFDGLRNDEVVKSAFVVKVVPGKGKSPIKTVERAIQQRKEAALRGKEFEFDELWCVLDAEQPQTGQPLADARSLAKQCECHLAISNPAFEVWLLAHFERTARSFLDCSQVMAQLDKHWQTAFGQEYQKNDPKVYARVQDRTREAIANAKLVRELDFRDTPDILDCNSATEVYRLVERLVGPTASE